MTRRAEEQTSASRPEVEWTSSEVYIKMENIHWEKKEETLRFCIMRPLLMLLVGGRSQSSAPNRYE